MAAITALRELRGLAAAWEFFLDDFVLVGARQRQRPFPLFAGFHQLWTAPGRQEELAALRADSTERPASPSDTHPRLTEGIAAFLRLPDDGRIDDRRRAISLLEQPEATLPESNSGCSVTARSISSRGISWAAGAAAAQVRDAASLLTKTAESGQLPAATMGTVVQLLQDGRATELVAPLANKSSEEALRYAAARLILDTIAAALIDRGGTWHRLSWSGQWQLIDSPGVNWTLPRSSRQQWHIPPRRWPWRLGCTPTACRTTAGRSHHHRRRTRRPGHRGCTAGSPGSAGRLPRSSSCRRSSSP
jgi:hypothetical protein